MQGEKTSELVESSSVSNARITIKYLMVTIIDILVEQKSLRWCIILTKLHSSVTQYCYKNIVYFN
jgi:hypothetical protein